MRHTKAALSRGGITHSLTRWGLREFFERAPDGLVGDPLHVPELDHPVGQQPQRPASSPLGRLRARERHQARLGAAIQDAPPRRPARLSRHQRNLQPLLAEAPPFARRRGRAGLQGLGDPLVGPGRGAPCGIGLEQDTSVKQLARVYPATRTSASRCSRSSSARWTTYLLCMANLPHSVAYSRGYAIGFHHATEP